MQITNLPASSSFAANDVLAIEVNGTTYKVTGATLAAALQTIGEFVTTSDTVTTTQDGLMIASDKAKLNGIAAGAQVNSITGVKGNAEGSYRVGNINLTSANIGALALSGGTVTGAVTRKVDTDFDNPPSTEEWNGIIPYTDSGSDVKGGVYNLRETDGSYRTLLGARGSNGWGYIAATIDASGNQGYIVTHPQAMLSALNIRWTKVTGTTGSTGVVGLGLAKNRYMVFSVWSSVSSGDSQIATPMVTSGGTNWSALVETISHTAVANTAVTLYVGYIDFGAGNIS